MATDCATGTMHWRAPTAMLAALLVGVLFAIEHNAFYYSLLGNQVPTTSYSIAGITISPQQVNVAAGTAFAFLVQSCLVTAASIAYTQVLWTTSIGRPVRLGALDTICSALQNPFELFNVAIWRKFRVHFLFAVITWLIPIASVVAPATLTMVQLKSTNSSLLPVPNIEFNSLNFGSAMPPLWGIYLNRSGVSYYKYTGPQLLVKQIATAVAAQGSILAITPPALNTSWTSDIISPTMRCDNVSTGLRTAIEENVRSESYDCLQRYAYVAWKPKMNNAMPFSQINEPFRTRPLGPMQPPNPDKADSVPVIANASVPTTLYVTVIPETDAWANISSESSCLRPIRNSTILQCTLYNSSRTLEFNYLNGDQHITSRDVRIFSQDSVFAVDGVYGPGDPFYSNDHCATLNTNGAACMYHIQTAANLAYQALMDSFGQLLVGTLLWPPPGAFGINAEIVTDSSTIFTTSNVGRPSSLSSSSSLSHSSSASSTGPPSPPKIMSIWDSPTHTDIVMNGGVGMQFIEETSMTSTVIFGLPIFQALRRWISKSHLYGIKDLKPTLEKQHPFVSKESYGASLNSLNVSLKDALEQLFDNITISLMSLPTFRPSGADSVTSTRANVTATTFQNVYAYDPEKIWLSYGLALFFACVTTIIGFSAVLNSRACYQNNFFDHITGDKESPYLQEPSARRAVGPSSPSKTFAELFCYTGQIGMLA